jgi:glutamate-5-semialdehyde dehydrogenase
MEVQAVMTEMGRSARAAARVLASSSVEQRNEALLQIRAEIAAGRDAILAANEMDLEQGRESGLEAALLDRLALTPAQLDVLEQGSYRRYVGHAQDAVGHRRWHHACASWCDRHDL